MSGMTAQSTARHAKDDDGRIDQIEHLAISLLDNDVGGGSDSGIAASKRNLEIRALVGGVGDEVPDQIHRLGERRGLMVTQKYIEWQKGAA